MSQNIQNNCRQNYIAIHGQGKILLHKKSGNFKFSCQVTYIPIIDSIKLAIDEFYIHIGDGVRTGRGKSGNIKSD